MQILRGRTGQIIPVQFQDTTSVIGGGKTGLVFNTSGLVCYYKRELDTLSRAVTLATATIGTWATGGFKEIDASHMPGSYEFGLPNAAISASDASTWVEIVISGASGAYCPPLRLDLVAFDPQATIADAVLDAAASDHNDTGTIGALINLLSTIYSRIISIGGNVTYVSPVSPDGKTMHIIQNDDYLLANNRPLIFPLPIGFPLLTPGQEVTLAVAKFDKTTQLITGLALDDSTMRFEMPKAISKLMPRGKSDYSILELTDEIYRSTPYVGTAIVSRTRTS